MNSENGRKLAFKRVENPEGWKQDGVFDVAYICTNISRDACAWGDNKLEIDIANKLLETPDIFQFYDREGNHVSSPTPDEIIWPRFTVVEVGGGWSVLDQWLNERLQNSTISKQFCDQTVKGWNAGDYSKSDFQWIPYVPAPKELTPRYIEIDIEGGKSIYDTVTKQRRAFVWGENDEFEQDLEDWNNGLCGEPNEEWPDLKWIPHELPAPAPNPQYIACQHNGQFEGDFEPERWGVRRVADDCWEDFPDKTAAKDWAEKLNEDCENGYDWWTWYPRKVDDHKQPESETQEPLTLTDDSQTDMVFSPPHYIAGGIECIDAIRAALGDDGFIQFCRGVVIKYHWRAGLKGDAQNDLGKAAFYSQMAAHVANPQKFKDPRKMDTSKNNGHDKQEANG